VDEADALTRDELRRRASAGVSIVASRGLAILLLGFVGNVVVARLLTPHDFGLVAIGMAFVYLISTLSDGGLGAALIRRPAPPAIGELQALLAFQLSLSIGLAALTAVLAVPFGRTGWVIAVMVSSMPLAMLQLPGRIVLERSLSYHRLAIVELAQVFAYHAWAIGLVLAGFGVWGLATATLAMRAVAAIAMALACPAAVVRPRFMWSRVRPLIGFGLRFQGASVTTFVEAQGLNASIAVIAGISTLGLWSLARRVMEIPFLLFESLWRVSFPTMSQLIAAKEDVRSLIERAVGMAAIGSGIILTGLAASAPGLVPGLFGEQWRGAVNIVPPACLALAIAGPLSVATVGYLYAVGDAAAVLRAHVARMITLFAVALPLLPVLGAPATGVGWLAASIVDSIFLGRATLQWTSAHLIRPLLVPVTVGSGSAATGWLLSEWGGADLVSGVVGGTTAVALFTAGVFLLSGNLLRETARFALRSLRGAASRSTATDST
jgi:O-antigen/teichoic acid export membrane protein